VIDITWRTPSFLHTNSDLEAASLSTIDSVAYELWCFCAEHGCVKGSTIAQYLKQLSHTTELVRAEGQEFTYRNPETGVYGYFDLYDPLQRPPVTTAQSFRNAGLTITVNLLRPSFFALELMPVIEQLCLRLRLVVIDPQSDLHQIEEADADRLTQRWNTRNQGLVRYLAQRPGLRVLRPYLSVAHSLESWKFCYERIQYQDRLGAAVLVPPIRFAAGEDGHVQRVVAWRKPGTSGMSQVFPPCDYVALAASSQNVPVKYVRTSKVLDSLKEVLSETGSALGNLPMLPAHLLGEASRAFDRLESAGAGERLTQIEPDAFVDCEA
jgi:hypothetical protein